MHILNPTTSRPLPKQDAELYKLRPLAIEHAAVTESVHRLDDLLGLATSSGGDQTPGGGAGGDSLGERLREGVEAVVMMADEMAVLQRQVGGIDLLGATVLQLQLGVVRQHFED